MECGVVGSQFTVHSSEFTVMGDGVRGSSWRSMASCRRRSPSIRLRLLRNRLWAPAQPFEPSERLPDGRQGLSSPSDQVLRAGLPEWLGQAGSTL